MTLNPNPGQAGGCVGASHCFLEGEGEGIEMEMVITHQVLEIGARQAASYSLQYRSVQDETFPTSQHLLLERHRAFFVLL